MIVRPRDPGQYEATQWFKGDPVPDHTLGEITPCREGLWRFVDDAGGMYLKEGEWIVTSPEGVTLILTNEQFRIDYEEMPDEARAL